MTHTEQYTDRELQEMHELCAYIVNNGEIAAEDIPRGFPASIRDIHKIALVEINRELDMRKLKKEGTK